MMFEFCKWYTAILIAVGYVLHFCIAFGGEDEKLDTNRRVSAALCMFFHVPILVFVLHEIGVI